MGPVRPLPTLETTGINIFAPTKQGSEQGDLGLGRGFLRHPSVPLFRDIFSLPGEFKLVRFRGHFASVTNKTTLSIEWMPALIYKIPTLADTKLPFNVMWSFNFRRERRVLSFLDSIA